MMKSPNLTEIIGLVIMFLGFIFMILNDVWENNPIPGILGRNQMFLWGGLVVWAFGNLTGKKDKKDQK